MCDVKNWSLIACRSTHIQFYIYASRPNALIHPESGLRFAKGVVRSLVDFPGHCAQFAQERAVSGQMGGAGCSVFSPGTCCCLIISGAGLLRI